MTSRPIETVQQNEQVYACDMTTGEWRWDRVAEPLSREYQGVIITIEVAGWPRLLATWVAGWPRLLATWVAQRQEVIMVEEEVTQITR